MTKTELDSFKQDIKDGIQSEFKDIKSEFKDIKSEFREMKSEMKEFKSDFRDMKSEFKEFKSDFKVHEAKIEVLLTNIQKDHSTQKAWFYRTVITLFSTITGGVFFLLKYVFHLPLQ